MEKDYGAGFTVSSLWTTYWFPKQATTIQIYIFLVEEGLLKLQATLANHHSEAKHSLNAAARKRSYLQP